MQMKHKILIALSVLMVVGAFTVYASESLYGTYSGYKKVKVVVNDAELRVRDTPGFIINGNTVLPLRETAEVLNAYVKWDEKTMTVDLVRPNVHMMVASRLSTLDGENVSIQAPFGKVKKGSKLTFGVYSQVDSLPKGDIQFKIAIYDPTGTEVFSSDEQKYQASADNSMFYYPIRVDSFTFRASGNYKVKFLFKMADSKEYTSIAEKVIASN
jgi:hypothetical protein